MLVSGTLNADFVAFERPNGGEGVPRARGPEEFFEVFREVQQSRKARDEKPTAPRTPSAEPSRRLGDALSGELTLTYPAIAGSVVVVALLVVAGYLVGRQHGWRAALAQARQASTATTAAKTRTEKKVAAPEFMDDGTIFTLLTLGREAKDRQSVEAEARHLNSYGPFVALGLTAYAWRDHSGKYRLCARGMKGLSPQERQRVRDQVRRLAARSGKREYRDADFLAP